MQMGLGDSLLSLKASLWDFIELRGSRLWNVGFWDRAKTLGVGKTRFWLQGWRSPRLEGLGGDSG